MKSHVCPLSEDAVDIYVCVAPLPSIIAAHSWKEARGLLRAKLEERGLPREVFTLRILVADEPGITVFSDLIESLSKPQGGSTEEGP